MRRQPRRSPISAYRRAFCGLAAAFFLFTASSRADITLLHNVVGYTPSAHGWQRFSALEFDNSGRITRVLPREPLAIDKEVEAIDGRGRVVLPGLIDAHAHLLGQAQVSRQVNLTGSNNRAEVGLRIRQYMDDAQLRRDGWILGRGWNQVLWPDPSFPTAAQLDAIDAGGRPMYFRRIDGHAGWANSAALRIAGITRHTPDPQGGRIFRDAAGLPTGVLIDAAMGLVDKHIPEEDTRARDSDIRATVAVLNSEGLTGVHQAGLSLANVRRLDGLFAASGMPLRLYLMLDDDVDLAAFGRPWLGRHDDRLTVRSVKIYADGALGSRGAALLEPYSDEPGSSGLLFAPDAELFAKVKRAHDAGFQTGIHAIGDAGNRQALDAIEAALAGRANTLRHRIEHVQVLHLDDLPRLAQLGVIASMQPVHAVSDMNMAEDRVGAKRIAGAYAWRSLLDRGTVIAAGSDFPVELTNPFHGIHAAVARRDHDGRPTGGWYRDEAMTRVEAVTSYTLSAAYAAHQEDSVGSLEVGKWADFIVIDRDVMTVPEQDIFGTRVLETWVGGQRVHRLR